MLAWSPNSKRNREAKMAMAMQYSGLVRGTRVAAPGRTCVAALVVAGLLAGCGVDERAPNSTAPQDPGGATVSQPPEQGLPGAAGQGSGQAPVTDGSEPAASPGAPGTVSPSPEVPAAPAGGVTGAAGAASEPTPAAAPGAV